MGTTCCKPARHRRRRPGDAHAVVSAPAAEAGRSPEKAKLDPRDFEFVGLSGETRVKLPGTVGGQQFAIDRCRGCALFLLDACAMVTVDACSDCALFIGPTDGAVFLRGCTNCRCVALCGQLRARDCEGCGLSLYCRTRPAVEACRGLAFRAFGFPYSGLAAQMAARGLPPLADRWWDVHDFTPPAAWAEPNWRIGGGGGAEGGGGSVARLEAFLWGGAVGSGGGGGSEAGCEQRRRSKDSQEGAVSERGVSLEFLDGGSEGGVDDGPPQTGAEAPAEAAGAEVGELSATGQRKQQLAGGSGGWRLPGEVAELLLAAEADPLGPDALCAVPSTGGEADAASASLLLFPPGSAAAVLELVARHYGLRAGGAACQHCEGCELLRTNEAALPPEAARRMAAAAGWGRCEVRRFVAPQRRRPKRRAGGGGASAGAAIGLEVRCGAKGGAAACAGCAALAAEARALGALSTAAPAVARGFWELGISS
ncbi:hypothetical protein Rsub_01532 [Raphidocelis subcapitata]|uniref:C-CAP/cofactor C-like domain-containing protein n=1 Tax=Raphidocelis subcapitata TaxID=307507 RepID=A0A2V0NU06_9CHLO|nr:hypothetical protein Rsub_01532 [Raphidocelis subcapitata]|eukprot:GBF89033.1 hypothetical protein Rsub_01532 [Raphidocelis subcapitata]